MGPVYIILAMLIWSTSGVIIKASGVRVDELMFYSLLAALPLQAGLAYATRGEIGRPSARTLMRLACLGPFTLINTFSFFYSLKHTSITNALGTHYLAPVLVALAAWAVLREAPTLRLAASLALSLAGLWLLLGISPSGLAVAGLDGNAMGMIAGLVSAFAYAVVIIMSRALARHTTPYLMVLMQSLVMMLLLAPFIRTLTPGHWYVYVLTGVIHSTLAPALYFKGLRTVEAARAGVLGYFEPLAAVLLGVVFLGEVPAAMAVAGGGLILISGYLTITAKRPSGAGRGLMEAESA